MTAASIALRPTGQHGSRTAPALSSKNLKRMRKWQPNGSMMQNQACDGSGALKGNCQIRRMVSSHPKARIALSCKMPSFLLSI